MSWLQKLLPPKINRSDSTAKKTVPEGLWSKCQGCGTVLYSTDLEQNAQVCPKCDHHHRISARARLDLLLDPEGRFEIGAEVLPVDALKFKDSRRYSDRLVDAERSSGETESLVVLQGAIRSIPAVVVRSHRRAVPTGCRIDRSCDGGRARRGDTLRRGARLVTASERRSVAPRIDLGAVIVRR